MKRMLLLVALLSSIDGYGLSNEHDFFVRVTLLRGRQFMVAKGIEACPDVSNRVSVAVRPEKVKIKEGGIEYKIKTRSVPVKSAITTGLGLEDLQHYSIYNATAPDIVLAEGTLSVFKNHAAASVATYGVEMQTSSMPMRGLSPMFTVTTNGEVVVFRRKDMSRSDKERFHQPEEFFQWMSLICRNVAVKFVAKSDENVRRNKLEIALKVLKAFCPDADIGDTDSLSSSQKEKSSE